MAFIHKQVLLIYGDSIFLAGIAESLRARPDLTVILHKPSAGFASLMEIGPQLVLVDDAQTTARQVDELLAAFPANHSPAVMRLNADSQRLTIVSSQQFPAASFAELLLAVETILDRGSHDPTSRS